MLTRWTVRLFAVILLFGILVTAWMARMECWQYALFVVCHDRWTNSVLYLHR